MKILGITIKNHLEINVKGMQINVVLLQEDLVWLHFYDKTTSGKAWEKSKEMRMVFIDLEKAYDSVLKSQGYQALKKKNSYRRESNKYN